MHTCHIIGGTFHYADFDSVNNEIPDIDSLTHKIDLNAVSSVVSNVSASSDSSSGSTIKTLAHSSSTTKITIHGYVQSPSSSSNNPKSSSDPHNEKANRQRSNTVKTNQTQKEIVLLTLHPQSHSIASEWLDGLLMLLNQQPITAETNKLINLVSNYGLKIRLLNVRFDDATFIGECPDIPSREGLDEDYYYDIFAGA
ncbi:hypothetical protein CIHG_07186 [Coccidioides immitis H538.4]|uniref:PH domain-containing protein n=1 Tax=Coccidioides immitis H538.4 TaxID=396776 RepID=A0A0J8RW41_COCIT|nr:hypothetical protein CIHG_07186 [Coccidioides immitis H538.4]